MSNLWVLTVREWKAFWYSPVAYVVGAFFLLLQGWVFWLLVAVLNDPRVDPTWNIAQFFFGGTLFYWVSVTMLAPLLTMRTFSEEKRTGTIEVLLSAPVTDAQVVVAKFLGAWLSYCALWGATVAFFLIFQMHGRLDWGPIATGYLGTWLLGAVLVAMGVLASSFTRNQIIASVVAFVLILMLFSLAGTFDFAQLQSRLPGLGISSGALALVGLLIFCGAVGKSAQFPLHVWLPDAMEGPTPVSALIHAATMVAAGVYMLCRVAWLLAPQALEVIALIGGITALMAAAIAVTQSDIKRVLAYSTLSQLGYMVMAVGLGGSLQAMFHLTTHAFFKALLFLAAGSVIIALHHEQDIWKMGGLKQKMPLTFWTFLVGTLALAGVWPLSGFYSKDEILLLALEHNRGLFLLGAFTALLTAFYMGRVFGVVFLGRPREAHAFEHARESPLVMTGPMLFLAALSIIGGWFSAVPRFLRPESGPGAHSLALQLGLLAIPMAGFLVSGLLYWRGAASDEPLHKALGPLYRAARNKFYFDEFYLGLVKYVQGSIAALCEFFDRWILQGLAVGGLAWGTGLVGRSLRLLQTGQVRFYAFLFGAGVVLIVYFTLLG